MRDRPRRSSQLGDSEIQNASYHPVVGLPVTNRWGLQFNGPVSLLDAPRYFDNLAGVYVIVSRELFSEVVIDVGESQDVGTRLQRHDRFGQWFTLTNGLLYVYVAWDTSLVNESTRRWSETLIRRLSSPRRYEP